MIDLSDVDLQMLQSSLILRCARKLILTSCTSILYCFLGRVDLQLNVNDLSDASVRRICFLLFSAIVSPPPCNMFLVWKRKHNSSDLEKQVEKQIF